MFGLHQFVTTRRLRVAPLIGSEEVWPLPAGLVWLSSHLVTSVTESCGVRCADRPVQHVVPEWSAQQTLPGFPTLNGWNPPCDHPDGQTNQGTNRIPAVENDGNEEKNGDPDQVENGKLIMGPVRHACNIKVW